MTTSSTGLYSTPFPQAEANTVLTATLSKSNHYDVKGTWTLTDAVYQEFFLVTPEILAVMC